MSANNLDRQPEERLITEIKEIRRIATEARTLQTQGISALQIGYTSDAVAHWNVAPNTGLIGTFIFTLEYDDPQPNDVVFGELDIAVNKGEDSFDPVHTLTPYYGALRVELVNDLYFAQAWNAALDYWPVVKVARLYTHASGTADDFYIHARWRYVGVGKQLKSATGDISILP